MLLVGGCVDIPAPATPLADGAADDAPTADVGGPDARPSPDGAPDVAVADRGPPIDLALADMALADMALTDMAPVDMALADEGPADLAPDQNQGRGQLAMSIDGFPVGRGAFLLPLVVRGAQQTFTLRFENTGDGPLTLTAEPQIVALRELRQLTVGPIGAPVELEPGGVYETELILAGRVAGPVEATLVVSTDAAEERRVEIGAGVYVHAHVAIARGGGNTVNVSQRTFDGGEGGMMSWRSSAIGVELGDAPDVACGGTCRPAQHPDGPSDARCVVVGERALRYSDDGAVWNPVDLGIATPDFVAVDYGPPWMALTAQGAVWRSDDGVAWALAPIVLPGALGEPRDLAVSEDGVLLAVGTNGARWRVPPAFDEVVLIESDLLRVADAPGGGFLAVGHDGTWLLVEAGGAESEGSFGDLQLEDAAFGEVGGVPQWFVVETDNHWRSPLEGRWSGRQATGAQRLAIGEVHKIGVRGGSPYRYVGGSFEQLDGPGRLLAIAAGRLCPEDGGGEVDPGEPGMP